MNIAYKEARESLYWIKLIEHGELVDFNYQKSKEKKSKNYQDTYSYSKIKHQ